MYTKCVSNIYRIYRIFIDRLFLIIRKKMKRYLRSDATRLSEKDIQDIIGAKNSMKRASEVMANKYKISSRRVYQIWRGVYPPIDPKEMVSYPPTDPPSDSKNMVSTNTDLSHVEKTDPHKSLTSIIPENKSKKTRKGNPKAKSVRISELPDVIPLGSIQTKPTLRNSVEGTQDKGLHGEELRIFYEKEAKRDEKNKADTAHFMAIT